MQRAAILIEFYLGEAMRLSGVQPLYEEADQASMLWAWMAARGKRHVTLPELVQFGPAKMRKAETARSLMAVPSDHYMVCKVPDDSVEFDGKARREAWEVRL